MGERWEDMPAVETAAFDAIDASSPTALPHTVISAMTENALAAAVGVVPVVPVRVLRDWIEQERALIGDPYSTRLALLHRLSRVLDDYEKENPK